VIGCHAATAQEFPLLSCFDCGRYLLPNSQPSADGELDLSNDGLDRDISKSEAASALKPHLDRSCRTKCSPAAGTEFDEQGLSRGGVCLAAKA
jgi:hypothetical protein